MKEKIYIAVDLGGSHGRVFCGGSGFPLELQYEFPTLFHSQDDKGNYCWDIDFIYANILTGIKEVYGKHDPSTIVSIGIDCFGNDHGLLDADNNLCAPVFHGRSNRTRAVCDTVVSLMGGHRNLYNLTGITDTYYDTINQLYATKCDMPEKYKKVKSVLILPDLLAFWLTGIKQTEKTAVSVTQLYNPTKLDYEPSILTMLELSRDCFAPIMESGTYRGFVTPAVCEQMGIALGLRFVNVAEHDTASSVLTLMDNVNNMMFISSGTMSVIGCIIDRPFLTDAAYNSNFSSETAVSGKIRILKNFLGMWIVNECKKSWGKEAVDFKVLDEETLKEKEFPSAIDPSDDLFIAPNSLADPMAERICTWCKIHGQPVPQNRGQVMVSIYKGLATKYKETLHQLEILTGKTIRRIAIVGGGSKNGILNQWTADYCGMKVEAGPVEASASGNIIMQMLASGEISTYAEGLKKLDIGSNQKVYYPICYS